MKKLLAVAALVFTIGAFAPVDADAGRYSYRNFCGIRPAVHVHGPGCGHWVAVRPVVVRPVHNHYWGCGCPGWNWARSYTRPYYRPYVCL